MSTSFQSFSKLPVSSGGVSVCSAPEINAMSFQPIKYGSGWRVGNNGNLIKLKRDAVAVCKLLNHFGDWEFTANLALFDFQGYAIEEERKCFIDGGRVCVVANRSHVERNAYGDIEFAELANTFLKETLINTIK